jgi:triosephosphate isomerase (TIM)
MRKPIVAGNWKLNKTAVETAELIAALKPLVADVDGVEVVVCPPFTSLSAAHVALKGSRIGLGAQNVYWEASGAFTGEISADMLLTSGCRYVIIGHSERRQYFAETDAAVNRKLVAALGAGLTPIVCCGETLDERQAGRVEAVVLGQVDGAFQGIAAADVTKVVVAYEPVWAIGTGVNASPEQAQEVHAMIRARFQALYSPAVAAQLRLQYGGSVKSSNADAIFAQPDIDGGLIGGSALLADEFATVVKAAGKVR